jgi:methylmalonyl-CoA/ethylmalonyl-CoA epimerase
MIDIIYYAHHNSLALLTNMEETEMTTETSETVAIEGIAQIAFTVSNLEEAKAFYRDVLGLRFLFDAGKMSFFQCGPVRLMIGEGPQTPATEGTIVYFRVADLTATAQILASRGVPFVQQPHLVARMKSHDLWLAFLKDPAGNTLGLMSEMVRTVEAVTDDPSSSAP